jgi:hypothetical protein
MRRHAFTATTALIALIAPAVLLAGCASKRLAFDKPGVTVEEQKRDEAACLRVSADDSGGGQILAAYRVDREAYARCMTTLGYKTVSR